MISGVAAGIPWQRSPNVDPHAIVFLRESLLYPYGLVLIGEGVDLDALLFDMNTASEFDQRFLRCLNITK